jgi:hypothetical protein
MAEKQDVSPEAVRIPSQPLHAKQVSVGGGPRDDAELAEVCRVWGALSPAQRAEVLRIIRG